MILILVILILSSIELNSFLYMKYNILAESFELSAFFV